MPPGLTGSSAGRVVRKPSAHGRGMGWPTPSPRRRTPIPQPSHRSAAYDIERLNGVVYRTRSRGAFFSAEADGRPDTSHVGEQRDQRVRIGGPERASAEPFFPRGPDCDRMTLRSIRKT